MTCIVCLHAQACDACAQAWPKRGVCLCRRCHVGQRLSFPCWLIDRRVERGRARLARRRHPSQRGDVAFPALELVLAAALILYFVAMAGKGR